MDCLFCPMPIRIQDGEPVFAIDFRAINADKYFLTIKYEDSSTHGVSLKVPRKGPAKPRIEKWLAEFLPGAELIDWCMQEPERSSSFKGLTGLMSMRIA